MVVWACILFRLFSSFLLGLIQHTSLSLDGCVLIDAMQKLKVQTGNWMHGTMHQLSFFTAKIPKM
jgi:hypothetical protein